MKTNLIVLCGGKSTEHEISLISATAIINSVNKNKFNVYAVYINRDGVWANPVLIEKEIGSPDELVLKTEESVNLSIARFLSELPEGKTIVFPALHGTYGEDGTIQGLLEVADIPYVCSEVMSSAIGMDKVIMRNLFDQAKIPQAKYYYFRDYQWKEDSDNVISKIETLIGYPCYVKPAKGGSSVGISRAANREELLESVSLARKYDLKILVEEELIGREIMISVIGNYEPKVSIPGEFIVERPFLDYQAKYLDKKLIPVIPARMSAPCLEEMTESCKEVYKTLDCRGLVRIDYFIDKDENFYCCEANTMPGFTSLSMPPVLWANTDGTSYSELVEKIIDMGFELYEEKKKLVWDR